MIDRLPYPFDVATLRLNKAFMLFCPPDVLDEERRPVLEGRSLLHTLDPSDFQPCPYGDSRRGAKPMNVESLKAFSRNQDAVVNFIRGAGQFVIACSTDELAEPDLGRLYALSYIGYRAPTLYFCNKLFDDSLEIPAVCSVTSRFFQGLLNMLALIALEHGGHLAGVRMSGRALYQYADEHGHLVGSAESCAASKTTIIKYLDLCIESCRQVPSSAASPQASGIELEGVCRIAQVTMVLEFSSLVYETLRCWLWHQEPRQDPSKIVQRYATKHCFLAKKISMTDDPFAHPLFKRAQNFLHTFGRQEPCSQSLVQVAGECVDQVRHECMSPAQAHERLKHQVLDVFGQQAEAVEPYVAGGRFLSSDFDMFFGPWPG
ncbi:hypothetical protein [Pseudomonas peli]|uniref:hypothetical protein n=1 Tax=Pseudomonas peli TaxID=592361 RepID=UPI0024ADBC7D|nr:hypothetical protein [Pseudomonas peli]